MKPRQLVGKFVRVKLPSSMPNEAWEHYYTNYNSKGTPGKIYMVVAYEADLVRLKDSNWHKLEVLELCPSFPIL